MHIKDHKRSAVNKAGTYTYGLYMYHVLVIVILARLFDRFHLPLDHAINALLFTIMALAGTIGFSLLSYYLFEKPFLRLKRFFR